MKITITGSLGHISRPLAEQLISEGHTVTIVSSDAAKSEAIKALGAIPAIGSVEDKDFIAGVFTGADAVYCMMPPANFFNPSVDFHGFWLGIAGNYAEAIRRAGVTRVVFLSSVGAHMESGNGMLSVYYTVEKIIGALEGVSVTFMRPVSFYYNLQAYLPLVKSKGIIAANYGGNKVPWVAPADIAAAIAEELVKITGSQKIRYVASEELSGPEVAAILGAAIGKPELQWVIVPDDQVLQSLVGAGMQPVIAEGMVEMYGALRTGLLQEDYNRNRPSVMGKVKMTEYAKEFAEAYHKLK